jgi:hypothetical protein
MDIEVVKTRDGQFRWRMRRPDGSIMKVERGGGVPGLRRMKGGADIRRAWQTVLKDIYETQQASG